MSQQTITEPHKAEPQPQSTAYDLIVVGAGLVGAALATALAKGAQTADLRIAVVEASPVAASTVAEIDSDCDVDESNGNADEPPFDPRVVALTQASQALLYRIGAWQLAEQQRICPYGNMEVWDAEGTAHIHFDSRELQQPQLGHIVENRVLTRAILTQMQACPAVELLCPERVADMRRIESESLQSSVMQVELETGRLLRAPLVVAADGANSFIRQLADFKTCEWDYGHHAIVTTVRTQEPHQFTAWQRFISSGPLAFLPLQHAGDDHYCSIVWSLKSELAGQMMALGDKDFCKALAEAFEHRLGEVLHCDKRFSFPLRQRHALDYSQPGIVLVGDAAHTIHPLAGQGVNLGFLDVAVLVEELQRALERQIPLQDASILRRYQRRRQGDNLTMMAAMEGFKHLFGAKDLSVRWLRNEGMTQLNSVPLLKNFIAKQAMGL